MDRPSRCDVFEAEAKVEEVKEGDDEFTNDAKARLRPDKAAMRVSPEI
jgi:hypothetical protein